jgi:NAD(P)-dependent dehydrogenase (short-subunit alcohol dehydrogenase family)
MQTLIIGNGDGIGLALTRKLLADGKDVIGVSRRPLAPLGERHRQHTLDVLHPQFAELMGKIVAEAGAIDTMVYCAGIGEPFETHGVDVDGDTIRVNFAALADVVRAVLPGMRERSEGRIVGISSIGDRPASMAPAYGGSKAGMTAYLLGLRKALRKWGIRVSAVRLGFVDTKMAKSPIRPMMISADRAAEIVADVIARGPAVKTYPRTMGILAPIVNALMS